MLWGGDRGGHHAAQGLQQVVGRKEGPVCLLSLLMMHVLQGVIKKVLGAWAKLRFKQ